MQHVNFSGIIFSTLMRKSDFYSYANERPRYAFFDLFTCCGFCDVTCVTQLSPSAKKCMEKADHFINIGLKISNKMVREAVYDC